MGSYNVICNILLTGIGIKGLKKYLTGIFEIIYSLTGYSFTAVTADILPA
jgi:hypothetical protein